MGFIAHMRMCEAYYIYCWGIALALNVAHTTGTQTTTTKTSLSASIVFASYGMCYVRYTLRDECIESEPPDFKYDCQMKYISLLGLGREENFVW